MKVLTMPQGSLEWLAARAGMVTASRIKDVMASKSTAGYADYRAQIVAEILTGVPNESGFVSDAMKWGTDKEPLARAEYEMFCAWNVEEWVLFCIQRLTVVQLVLMVLCQLMALWKSNALRHPRTCKSL